LPNLAPCQREWTKKKICDTNPLVVVVVKRVNFKESLTELNITKQRKFVLVGGSIMNYANQLKKSHITEKIKIKCIKIK
jgi:hypothetical protein